MIVFLSHACEEPELNLGPKGLAHTIELSRVELDAPYHLLIILKVLLCCLNGGFQSGIARVPASDSTIGVGSCFKGGFC